MIPTLSRRLGAAYAGLTPVFLATLLAAGLTAIAWPLLERVAIYRDVIVGESTLANVDKARDFRALYVFFAATALHSLALAAFFRRGRPKEEEDDPRHDVALSRILLLCAPLPALWWLSVALTAPARAKYIMPWTTLDATVGAVVVIIALALVWKTRLMMELHAANERSQAIPIALSGILGAFAGLGVATAIGRFVPTVGGALAHRGLAFAIGGALIALGAAELVRRKAGRSLAERNRSHGLLLMGLQVPLPLLFFVLVPAPLLNGNQIIDAEYKPALTFSLAALVVVAWILLWRRYQFVHKERADETPQILAGTESWLAPLCIAAIALYVALPSLPAPELVVHPDHLHFGERALPWQQWAEWGKRPYVDFIPIHGLMALSRGFFNSVFFDNAAPGFDSAALVLGAIFTVTLFLAVQPLVGTLLALVIAAFSLSPMMSDRFFFFTPAVFALVHPNLLARPLRWLVVWLLVVTLMVFYNAPIGTALTIGTLPAALFIAYRIARADARKFMALVLIAGAAIAVLDFIPNVEAMLRGFFQYVRENQAVNNVANGIAWEQNFHTSRSVSDFVGQFVWGLTRVSWMAVVLIALQLGWRELARPPEKRRQSLLWLTALLIPTLLIVAQWAFGRIDPVGGSRTDTLSYVCLFQILPVLLLLARPPGMRSRAAASIGLSLVIAASLISPHNLIRALLGHNALQPRVVYTQRGLINGEQIGLPNVGTVMPNQTVDEARALKTALTPLLRHGETYLNLGAASDFYYYLDFPVPTIYAETVVPGSGTMQARMLRQLAAHGPPVALAAPWEVLSLRFYYLYRDRLLRFPAIRRGRFVFLVDSTRAPEAGPIGSDEQVAMLDSIYRMPNLGKLPSAWGRSWRWLAPRFTSIVPLGSERIQRLRAVNAEANGSWKLTGGGSASLEYTLTDLNLRGRDADFVKLDFASPTDDGELRVSWAARGRPMGEPITMTPDSGTTTLLIPLGSTPSWILSPRLDALRFEVAGGGVAPGTHFTIRNVVLLHLNPPY